MQRIFVGILLGLLWLTPASAAFWIGQTYGPPTNANGKIAPLGAGGYITNQSIANDGTLIDRTDTNTGFIWNASAMAPDGETGTWQQLVSASSMPSGFVSQAALYIGGMYEDQITPSNSSIIYVVVPVITSGNPPNWGVYKSTNKGVTFSQTNFTPINIEPDFGFDEGGTGTPVKAWGQKMAIDPTDGTGSVVFVGTGNNGMFFTTNGGTSWTNILNSALPWATADGGYYPGFSGTAIGKQNNQRVFTYSYPNGVYLSTNLGTSWTPITNSTCWTGGTCPQIVVNGHIDPSNDYYYVVDGTGNAWQYSTSAGSPAWTKIYTNSSDAVYDIAVDPNTADHVVIADGQGNLAESNTGTTTISFGTFSTHCTSGNSPCAAADIAWMSIFPDIYTASVVFDPITAKTVHAVGQRDAYTATWTGSVSSSTQIKWVSQGRGIEQIVVNNVAVPSTGATVVAGWDSAIFALNLSSYPSNFYPGGTGVMGGWSLDYSGTFVAAVIDGCGDGSGESSAYSTSSGAIGTWTQFPNIPTNADSPGCRGNIAVSSSTNIIFAPGGVQPSYTTNCCTGTITWNLISISGVTDWSNFLLDTVNGREVTADTVIANTFYLMYPHVGEIYTSSNSGATWSTLTAISNSGFSADPFIKATPGEAGDFWVAGGINAGAGQINTGCTTGDLYHYVSGTLTAITNVGCASNVGFGKNIGSGYPSVACVCWVTLDGGSTYTYGLWESDNASTGAAPTWTLLVAYPAGNMVHVNDLAGDPGIHGRWYTALGGAGLTQTNYLLNRDLDPASNDNSPVGLAKVG